MDSSWELKQGALYIQFHCGLFFFPIENECVWTIKRLYSTFCTCMFPDLGIKILRKWQKSISVLSEKRSQKISVYIFQLFHCIFSKFVQNLHIYYSLGEFHFFHFLYVFQGKWLLRLTVPKLGFACFFFNITL